MTLKEALLITESNGYNVTKLNEVEYTTKAKMFGRIRTLSTANEFIEKMLLCMYNRQENDEKENRLSLHKNYRGFNQADAGTMSALAEQFYTTHRLTPAQYNLVKSLLKKYHRQTFEILQELDMIKVKGKLYYFDKNVYTASQIGVRADSAANELLDMVKIYTVDEFVKDAIKQAEEDAGALDDDELPKAKKLAADMFASGSSIIDAAAVINGEF